MTSNDNLILEYRLGQSELTRKIEVLTNNLEHRFDAVDRKFEVLERRFDVIDRKTEALTIQVQNNFDYQNMRADNLQTSVYWGFALITFFIAVVGVMVALAPSILEIFRSRRLEHDYVTSEQVQEIVDKSISKALDKVSMM